MTIDPRFLTISEVIEIHGQEIKIAGELSGIRDLNALESALGAPQASLNLIIIWQDFRWGKLLSIARIN
jgi:hypothetical protein